MLCPTCDTQIESGWKFCLNCGGSLSDGASIALVGSTTEIDGQQSFLVTKDYRTLFSDDSTIDLTDTAEEVPPTSSATVEELPILAVVPRRRRWLRTVRSSVLRREVGIPVMSALLVLAIVGGMWVDATGDLRATREDLRVSKFTLSETESKLVDMTKDRDKQLSLYTTTKSNLDRTQTALNRTVTKSETLAGQNDVLRTCLRGVQQAFVFLYYEDYISMAASLRAVDISCSKAAKLV